MQEEIVVNLLPVLSGIWSEKLYKSIGRSCVIICMQEKSGSTNSIVFGNPGLTKVVSRATKFTYKKRPRGKCDVDSGQCKQINNKKFWRALCNIRMIFVCVHCDAIIS
jgi:hypothetical protein